MRRHRLRDGAIARHGAALLASLVWAGTPVAAGCGDGGAPSDQGAGAGSSVATSAGGAGGGGGGAGGGASTPSLDPSLFDCTAKGIPERTTEVPASCATDRTCETRLVTGHRGVGGELGVIAPENTMSAVRAAILLGVDYVETDPRPTKDEVLVNLHDGTVDRTTDGMGDVDQMTLAELQALAVDSAGYPGDFSCERVPTIEELLLAAKGRVHVLLDANKTSRVDLIVQAVQKTGALEWAIFDTDSLEKIDEALALEPNLLVMVRVSSAEALDDKLAHLASHPPVLVELHDGSNPAELAPLVQAAGNRASTNVFVTDVAMALDRDPSLYGDFYDLGLAVVQTDRPELVLEHLGRRGP